MGRPGGSSSLFPFRLNMPLILMTTCERWLCSTRDGDGGGDFMTGSGMILFKALERHELGC